MFCFPLHAVFSPGPPFPLEIGAREGLMSDYDNALSHFERIDIINQEV